MVARNTVPCSEFGNFVAMVARDLLKFEEICHGAFGC